MEVSVWKKSVVSSASVMLVTRDLVAKVREGEEGEEGEILHPMKSSFFIMLMYELN